MYPKKMSPNLKSHYWRLLNSSDKSKIVKKLPYCEEFIIIMHPIGDFDLFILKLTVSQLKYRHLLADPTLKNRRERFVAISQYRKFSII